MMLVSMKGTLYVVVEQTYDEETATYTVMLNSGEKYQVTMGENNVVFTKVETESTEEENR